MRGLRSEVSLPHWYVRAPDHLGDGVLALPLLQALAGHARLTVAAPGWGPDLYGGLGQVVPKGRVPARADAAVLVKPAFRAVWEARHIPRRVGWPSDHRRLLLTEVVEPGAGHRAQQMARLGAAMSVVVEGPPRLEVRPLARPGVILFPLSATGATVEWTGYRTLADRLCAGGIRVVFAAGPGESSRLARIAGPHPMLPELSVRALAEVVAGAQAVVGNDSGLTHLAAAALRGAGRDPGRVVGIAGSTDPGKTGAPGARWITGPEVDCGPCYRKSCRRGLTCMDVSVDAVLELLRSWLEPGACP